MRKGIELRTERIDIRVSAYAKDVIQKEAKERGITVADLILLCVQIEINSIREPDEWINLI